MYSNRPAEGEVIGKFIHRNFTKGQIVHPVITKMLYTDIPYFALLFNFRSVSRTTMAGRIISMNARLIRKSALNRMRV